MLIEYFSEISFSFLAQPQDNYDLCSIIIKHSYDLKDTNFVNNINRLKSKIRKQSADDISSK